MALKLISFLLLLTYCIVANGSDRGSAFLVLKASVTDEVEQPKYICLGRKNRCTHIPPNQDFVKIKPGYYQLRHIDFSENEASSRGNVGFEELQMLKLKKGRVYFVGHIKLSNRSGGSYEMSLDQDLNLLQKACESFPEDVKLFPFGNTTNGKATKHNCVNAY